MILEKTITNTVSKITFNPDIGYSDQSFVCKKVHFTFRDRDHLKVKTIYHYYLKENSITISNFLKMIDDLDKEWQNKPTYYSCIYEYPSFEYFKLSDTVLFMERRRDEIN